MIKFRLYNPPNSSVLVICFVFLVDYIKDRGNYAVRHQSSNIRFFVPLTSQTMLKRQKSLCKCSNYIRLNNSYDKKKQKNHNILTFLKNWELFYPLARGLTPPSVFFTPPLLYTPSPWEGQGWGRSFLVTPLYKTP